MTGIFIRRGILRYRQQTDKGTIIWRHRSKIIYGERPPKSRYKGEVEENECLSI